MQYFPFDVIERHQFGGWRLKMLIFENMSRVARGGIGGVHLAGDEKIDRKDDSTK